jgi:hypothetical protein
MPVDLEMSNLGDLVFGPSRDLKVVQKADLMTQRIMVRLKLPKGSFIFSATMGSDINALLRSTNTAEGQARAVSIVTQALRPMDDLRITSISVKQDPLNPKSIMVFIEGSAILSRSGQAKPTSFQAEIPVTQGLTGDSETTERP